MKTYKTGTHRTVSPNETLARIRPMFPAMGITRLANITGLDNIGIPVAQAIRPNARGLAVSQGKGVDLPSALVSAAMESIETWHAEHTAGPLQQRSYDDMRRRGFPTADPYQLPASPDHPFLPHRPILWMEGEDWLTKASIWVPYSLVHTAYLVPHSEDGFLGTSSGLASGNQLQEAISHALCELMERHAIAQLDTLDDAALEARRLNLDTVHDPTCRAILDQLRNACIHTVVHDATTHLDVACFRAVICDTDPGPFRRLVTAGGFGCHPVREIALLRAITEAAQSRLTFIAGSRDDMLPEEAESAMDPARAVAMHALPPGTQTFTQTPTHHHETFEQDVAFLLARLDACGFHSAILFNLTQPQFEIPVVRAIVPGIRNVKYTFHTP